MAKKKIKGRNFKILILATAILTCFSYVVLGYQHKVVEMKRNKLHEIKIAIDKEKEINTQLKNKTNEINSDSYVEEVARTLNMVKPGEITYIDTCKRH